MDKIYSILLEVQHDISKIKSDISEIKKNINSKKCILNNFLFLENGYKLDSKFIDMCLSKHNIEADLGILLTVYNKDNIPIKNNDKKIYYYVDSWILDNSNHVIDTLINNLINTYMVFVKEDKTRFIESK